VEWVSTRYAALEPRNPNLAAPNVIEREQARPSMTESMAVDEIEEEAIAEVALWDRTEESLWFLTCEVSDGTLSSAAFVLHPVTVGDSDSFTH
jgi:hypothetical protein